MKKCIFCDILLSENIRANEAQMMEQNEWESLSPEEKRVQLYLKQKAMLEAFLERGAISKAFTTPFSFGIISANFENSF